jgi:hypothetical protein
MTQSSVFTIFDISKILSFSYATLLLIVLSAVIGAVAGVLVLGRRGAQQCRRPSSKQGRAILQRMNISHAGVTQWGLTHVDIKPHFTILDVGCGFQFQNF